MDKYRKKRLLFRGLLGVLCFPGMFLSLLFASASAQSATLQDTWNITPAFSFGPSPVTGNISTEPSYYGLNIVTSSQITVEKDKVTPDGTVDLVLELYSVSSLADFVAMTGTQTLEQSELNSLTTIVLAVGTDYVLSVGCPTGVPANRCSNAFIEVSAAAVPLPAAAWLFGSALVGFVMLSNRRRSS